MDVRDLIHHKTLEGFGPAVADKSSTNKWAIRGREQQLIDYFKKAKSDNGTSGNAIRGVAKDNPRRKIYHSEANRLFGELYRFTGNK